MGAGAGKTTLMDVIAGRKTQGEITGDILVNGHPKDQKTWSRVVGYVEQMDIHSPQVRSCQVLPNSQQLLPGCAELTAAPARVCRVGSSTCSCSCSHSLHAAAPVSSLQLTLILCVYVWLSVCPSDVCVDVCLSGFCVWLLIVRQRPHEQGGKCNLTVITPTRNSFVL